MLMSEAFHAEVAVMFENKKIIPVTANATPSWDICWFTMCEEDAMK